MAILIWSTLLCTGTTLSSLPHALINVLSSNLDSYQRCPLPLPFHPRPFCAQMLADPQVTFFSFTPHFYLPSAPFSSLPSLSMLLPSLNHRASKATGARATGLPTKQPIPDPLLTSTPYCHYTSTTSASTCSPYHHYHPAKPAPNIHTHTDISTSHQAPDRRRRPHADSTYCKQQAVNRAQACQPSDVTYGTQIWLFYEA